MLSVEEALERMLRAFAPLPPQLVALGDALGRVLAEDAVARVTQPPAAVSAMDGYAVRAADLAEVPCTLKVIAEIPAGSAYEGKILPGQTARIFTGAPLPAGADSVVIQEDTEELAGEVRILAAVAEGTYVRPAGLDFRAGSRGLAAGRRLGVRDIGLAAAMNLPWLLVRQRPKVALLATGDEVVMPGDPLGPNQIVSSNGLALAAFVTACGGEAVNLGIARDDRESLSRLAAGARGADLLVTTGGVSVGKHDLVRSLMGERELDLDFWKIAMRHGKPLLFGRLGDTPLLGLPGNPVSTLVCALLFLRPLLARLQGADEAGQARETALLGSDLPANDRRQDYLRARLERQDDGRLVALPFARQDSSMLATLAAAECLIVRRPLASPAAKGETVEIVPFGASLFGF